MILPTGPLLGTSLARTHASPDSGKAGADAFTIMKLAGHSSFTISQRYAHSTGETIKLAFDRLEKPYQKALEASISGNQLCF
jgi:hypothetical protein